MLELGCNRQMCLKRWTRLIPTPTAPCRTHLISQLGIRRSGQGSNELANTIANEPSNQRRTFLLVELALFLRFSLFRLNLLDKMWSLGGVWLFDSVEAKTFDILASSKIDC